MPFVKGQSGNPSGKNREKKYLAALQLALSEKSDIPRLRKIAEKAIQAAENGEPWAINHIADRLDGKPAQAIIGGQEDEPAVQFSLTDELTAKLDAMKDRIDDE